MNIEKYCEFEYIKKEFRPSTSYGKIYKENLKIISSQKELEKRYDAIEKALEIRKKKRFNYDKIKYHLKNIPHIDIEKEFSDISDVFICKKFINNYTAICGLLNKKEKDFFGFSFDFKELYDILNIDGFGDSFYLSDKYDKRLEAVRNEISEVSKKIEQTKKEFLEKIKKDTGISPVEDFIVVESLDIKKNFADYFNIEIYDSSKFVLKPKYPIEYIELIQKREKILSEEKKIEAEVIRKLIEKINRFKSEIYKSISAVLNLDIAVSSAELAVKYSLKRPQFGFKSIKVTEGFFIPLKEELTKIGVNYVPLSFTFDNRINIIQGSNMGGKSVVLKTVGVLQLMAQCGFFVPAKEFKTQVFDSLYALTQDEITKGLSNFAMEIYDFIRVYKNIEEKKVLILADEFAKTTNVSEAVSLINSIVADFSQRKNVFFFLATHFSGISDFNNLDFLRMKGFNKNKYQNFSDERKEMDISDKIKIINKFMDYEIIRIKNSSSNLSDALEISKIIGLDKKLYENALKFLEGKYENSKTKKKS
ncbi:MAG: hypothetical protein N2Z60_04955 [Elusimicrobiales bacterium]|nr:hypothetical protein [Elusimicrobiales bacterium]